MAALRRKAMMRGFPMRPLELISTCDVCGSHRAHGNHQKCSKIRQAKMRG